MKIELNNPTIAKLNKIMKEYGKIYKNVVLKYDFKKKKAILTLTNTCKK